MTEDTTTQEELKEEAKRATEKIHVAGNDLIKTVQALLREAAVRKITVQDKTGRTLIEFPLYAGIIGAVFVGSWTVLALIAAWFAEVSILIERDVDSDAEFSDAGFGSEPSVVGEAVERTAGTVSTTARSAAAGLGSVIGSAAHAAGDLARRAADTLEGRLNREDLGQDLMDKGEEAAQAIIKAAEAAAEPAQCAATTKSGTRCKRTAVAGSDFCSTHQPK